MAICQPQLSIYYGTKALHGLDNDDDEVIDAGPSLWVYHFSDTNSEEEADDKNYMYNDLHDVDNWPYDINDYGDRGPPNAISIWRLSNPSIRIEPK
ncbi:hypothetical protein BS17DRAFT_822430 [Gyrodon lividus]|nr:hypothetical protein BS17DRAFT_822430 [Gyrodon lividus]